jgi:hypothetical protein
MLNQTWLGDGDTATCALDPIPTTVINQSTLRRTSPNTTVLGIDYSTYLGGMYDGIADALVKLATYSFTGLAYGQHLVLTPNAGPTNEASPVYGNPWSYLGTWTSTIYTVSPTALFSTIAGYGWGAYTPNGYPPFGSGPVCATACATACAMPDYNQGVKVTKFMVKGGIGCILASDPNHCGTGTAPTHSTFPPGISWYGAALGDAARMQNLGAYNGVETEVDPPSYTGWKEFRPMSGCSTGLSY